MEDAYDLEDPDFQGVEEEIAVSQFIDDKKKLQQINFNAPADVEYIKLMKNTKGYNWDFKLVGAKSGEEVKLLERVKALNAMIAGEFEGGLE